MSEYLLTYLWVGMECVAAVLLFDAFSQRKKKQIVHWITVTCFAFLDATFLNLMSPNMASFGRIAIALAAYYSLHRILYVGKRIFSLYIAVIIYATVCCIDNIWFTFLILTLGMQNGAIFSQTFISSFLMHCLMLASCYLQLFVRKRSHNQTAAYRWYTIPAVFSAVSVLMIFFFGDSFQNEQISALPLFVCASFITCMQIAALLLVSWMEQNAYFREEALSLQTKSMAQKESIEALSAAYAQQRKLTHDFRAHLDTLSAMLVQQPFDIDAIKKEGKIPAPGDIVRFTLNSVGEITSIARDVEFNGKKLKVNYGVDDIRTSVANIFTYVSGNVFKKTDSYFVLLTDNYPGSSYANMGEEALTVYRFSSNVTIIYDTKTGKVRRGKISDIKDAGSVGFENASYICSRVNYLSAMVTFVYE